MIQTKANPTSREVNCPIHGTHGNLSGGQCWWCVKAGITPPNSSTKPTVTTTKVGVKKRIA